VAQNERRSGQTGPQQHAEGQHGEKTHDRLLEEMAEGSERERAAREGLPLTRPERHRLTQQREQHDEAEKNSEKNREERMMDQGGGQASRVRRDDRNGGQG
jgi:hypothetical protein